MGANSNSGGGRRSAIAARSVQQTSWRPRGNGIGFRQAVPQLFQHFSRDQESGGNRLPQPLHGEFDVIGLEVAPALVFRLVEVLREALKAFRGDLFSRDALLGEPLADERVSGHALLKRDLSGQAMKRGKSVEMLKEPA
jgi:hypothetical protein